MQHIEKFVLRTENQIKQSYGFASKSLLFKGPRESDNESGVRLNRPNQNKICTPKFKKADTIDTAVMGTIKKIQNL